MTEYRSEHTGKVVDDAVTQVKNNECKIKWGNILETPSIKDQTDLWNAFLRVEGSNSMTGNLTIEKSSPQITLNATDMEKGVVPLSSDLMTYFRFRDKNNSALGNVGYHQYTDGRTATIIGTNSPSGSGYVYISIGYDSLGNPYTYAPTPADGDNSSQIATTKWVRTAAGSGLGVVHLAEAETITGNKTFSGVTTFTGTANFTNGTATAATRPTGDSTTNVATTKFVHDGYVIKTGDTMTGDLALYKDNPVITLRNSEQTAGTTPSANKFTELRFRESTNTTVGKIGNLYTSTGLRYNYIGSANASGTYTAANEIRIGYDANGKVFTYAPTPAANDNTTKIATTEWAALSGNGLVHTTMNETIGGNKTFSGTSTFSGTTSMNGNVTFASGKTVTLSGTTTAVTPAASDNSTKVATTAFVKTYMTSNKSYTTTSVVKTEDITEDTPQLLRWYRKYADGWVEQGGLCQSYNRTITLPVAMKNTNYTVLATRYNRVGDYHPAGAYSKTTTTVIFKSSGDNGGTWRVHWYICGYAA